MFKSANFYIKSNDSRTPVATVADEMDRDDSAEHAESVPHDPPPFSPMVFDVNNGCWRVVGVGRLQEFFSETNRTHYPAHSCGVI